MNVLVLGPDLRNKKIKEFLISKGCGVFTKTENEIITLDFLREDAIDYIISNGYAPIIKEPVISAYRHRIINVHPSYLPYGRGIYGNFWSFFEGTPKGVSLHFIDASVDTGDIIFQKEVPLSDRETLKSSWEILYQEVERLFFDKWDDILNKNYRLIRQADLKDKGSYHTRKLSEKLLVLFPKRWDTPVSDIIKMGKEFSRLTEDEFWRKHGK